MWTHVSVRCNHLCEATIFPLIVFKAAIAVFCFPQPSVVSFFVTETDPIEIKIFTY